jgi:hypothetical protein
MSNKLSDRKDLLKYWNYGRYPDLDPSTINLGSKKKYEWKCDKADDHIFEKSPSNFSKIRIEKEKCPACTGRKTVRSNSLGTTHPEIAEDWAHDYKQPKNHTPWTVRAGSGELIKWRCRKNTEHIYNARVVDKTHYNQSCGICSGHQVSEYNCLENVMPELMYMWDFEANNRIDLKPDAVTKMSDKIAHWICRTNLDHKWSAQIKNISIGTRCPYCIFQKYHPTTSLQTLNPELAKEWHPNKNGALLPDMVKYGGGKKFWWLCPENPLHVYEQSIQAKKGRSAGCPYCRGLKVNESNSLQVHRPDIAAEWHEQLNRNLLPSEFAINSNKKVWWKCNKGCWPDGRIADDHVWESSISNRTSNGQGCPVCSGNKVAPSNSLLMLNPELSKEWHPRKNMGKMPSDYTIKSDKKVWWQCKKHGGHEWKSTISNRSNGNNCPFCTLTPQSRQELTITFELKRFFEINPRGFKTRIDDNMWTIDIYIPELSIGIEFDGSYWHKDKRALDKLKTEKLEAQGFKIIRVREEPLKKIFEIDIISRQPFDGKEITNDILNYILSNHKLNKRTSGKIERYLSKPSIQNEKALDDYIDQILEEKAEKKKN